MSRLCPISSRFSQSSHALKGRAPVLTGAHILCPSALLSHWQPLLGHWHSQDLLHSALFYSALSPSSLPCPGSSRSLLLSPRATGSTMTATWELEVIFPHHSLQFPWRGFPQGGFSAFTPPGCWQGGGGVGQLNRLMQQWSLSWCHILSFTMSLLFQLSVTSTLGPATGSNNSTNLSFIAEIICSSFPDLVEGICLLFSRCETTSSWEE